jgi:hypothetical protein
MVDLETARDYCLKLPEADEYDHFGKPAYRVKKKIFATLWLDEKRAVLKLSPADQSFYCAEYSFIYPVKGAWGKYGWTYVDLNKINESVFSKLLTSAWLNVAPKTAAKKHGLISPNH